MVKVKKTNKKIIGQDLSTIDIGGFYELDGSLCIKVSSTSSIMIYNQSSFLHTNRVVLSVSEVIIEYSI